MIDLFPLLYQVVGLVVSIVLLAFLIIGLWRFAFCDPSDQLIAEVRKLRLASHQVVLELDATDRACTERLEQILETTQAQIELLQDVIERLRKSEQRQGGQG